MYSAFQHCDTSDASLDSLFHYAQTQRKSVFDIESKASGPDPHDDSDLVTLLNDSVPASKLDSNLSSRLCINEHTGTGMSKNDQMPFPNHKNINLECNQNNDFQTQEHQNAYSLPTHVENQPIRHDSQSTNTTQWIEMSHKAPAADDFVVEKDNVTFYDSESSAEPKSSSTVCHDSSWDAMGLAFESLNDSMNTIPSFETFLQTRNNQDERIASVRSRKADSGIVHNLDSSGNSSMVNTNSCSSCSSSSGANYLPADAEISSMLETSGGYFEFEMNRNSYSSSSQSNSHDSGMVRSNRNSRPGLFMSDNVMCRALFADDCQSGGGHDLLQVNPISNEDPLEWCSSRQGMHAHARHPDLGYTSDEQQPEIRSNKRSRYDDLGCAGTDGKMNCYDPPTPEMGRKYFERRSSSSLSGGGGGGGYRVRKGSGSKPQQKGDTVTLKQPSFAEGHEEIGTFGFINFRKPGAWTRLKPGEDEDNRKRRVDAQRR